MATNALWDLLSTIDSYKRNALAAGKGLLAEGQEGVDWGRMLMSRVAEGVGNYARNNLLASQDASSVMPEVRRAGQNAMLENALNAGGLGAIKVWHGSPHTFNKWEAGKVGTGEGAAAYGYGEGGYHAEAKDVGRQYANDLARGNKERLKYDGQTVDPNSTYGRALEDVALQGKDAVLKRIDDSIRFNSGYAPDMANAYRDVAKKIASVDESKVSLNLGNLYEESLRWPDPAREAADPLGPQHFLDWDRPMKEQQNALRALWDSGIEGKYVTGAMGERRWLNPIDRDLTGEAQYRRLSQLLGSESKASEALSKAGVPGIRYLDAGSRGAGQGTANYVVFDPEFVEILSRNGIPVK